MKKFAVLGAAIIALFSLAHPAPASAFNPDDTTKSHIEAAEVFLAEAGASKHDTRQLINKIERNEPIGSAAGLPIVAKWTQRDGDFLVTTETYADGSIEVSSLEQPAAPDGLTDAEFEAGRPAQTAGETTAAQHNERGGLTVPSGRNEIHGSIKGCKVKAGSGYRSYRACTVLRQSATANISFTAAYTLVQKGNDYISGVSTPIHRCYVASCTDVKTKILRKKESRSGKAVARGSMNVTAPGGWASKSYWVELRVGGNKATVVNGG